MPIYEYECSSCANVIEVWQSVADDPMTTCPACTGTLKKIISMSSFHLKGNGWYADGYSSAADSSKPAKTCGVSDAGKPACSVAGAEKAAGGASADSASCCAAKAGSTAEVKKKTDSSTTAAATPCSGC